jgi:hypothetical protein
VIAGEKRVEACHAGELAAGRRLVTPAGRFGRRNLSLDPEQENMPQIETAAQMKPS